MRRVIIESPYAGDIPTHVRYARRCVEHSLLRNEAPLASHLLYTQEGILDDHIPAQRMLGMDAGREWIPYADAVIAYQDYGISQGMQVAIDFATEIGIPVMYRNIGRLP